MAIALSLSPRLSTRSLVLPLALGCSLLATQVVLAQAPPSPTTPEVKKPPAKPKPAAAPKSVGPTLATRIPPPGPAELPLFGARSFIDQRSGLSLTVPAGWLLLESPESGDSEISRMILDGPGQPAPACGISVLKAKQPPGINQAQLNKAIHDDRNVEGIRKNVTQGGRRLIELKRLTMGGFAGVSLQIISPGSPYAPDTTTYLAFFEAIGRRYSVNCNVLTNDLDTMRPDIEAIVRSMQFPNI